MCFICSRRPDGTIAWTEFHCYDHFQQTLKRDNQMKDKSLEQAAMNALREGLKQIPFLQVKTLMTFRTLTNAPVTSEMHSSA